jgi:hypothetical protein
MEWQCESFLTFVTLQKIPIWKELMKIINRKHFVLILRLTVFYLNAVWKLDQLCIITKIEKQESV